MENLDKNNVESLKTSGLCLTNKNLRTIDIIPVIEGAAIGTIIVAIIAIILAVVVYILAVPPSFDDFRSIDQAGKQSYLFSGPQNVVGEGGPVPVGYGRLLVGSQTISAAYVVRDFGVVNPRSNAGVVADNYTKLQQYFRDHPN